MNEDGGVGDSLGSGVGSSVGSVVGVDVDGNVGNSVGSGVSGSVGSGVGGDVDGNVGNSVGSGISGSVGGDVDGDVDGNVCDSVGISSCLKRLGRPYVVTVDIDSDTKTGEDGERGEEDVQATLGKKARRLCVKKKDLVTSNTTTTSTKNKIKKKKKKVEMEQAINGGMASDDSSLVMFIVHSHLYFVNAIPIQSQSSLSHFKPFNLLLLS